MLGRIWFGISDLYAIKRYMHLSDMQLTDFVCIDIKTQKQKSSCIEKIKNKLKL